MYGAFRLFFTKSKGFLPKISIRRFVSTDVKMTLYGDLVSPAVRFVKITASILDIPLKFKNVELFEKENKTEGFAKLNPLQKVPVLEAGEEILTDSHAISVYLCEYHAYEQTLYPDTALVRGRILEMMFFDACHLFAADSAIYTEYLNKQGNISPERLEQWDQALGHLENRLRHKEWLAGMRMTLSDLCCGSTVSSCQVLIPSTDKYPKVNDWLKRLNEVSDFKDITNRGLRKIRGLLSVE